MNFKVPAGYSGNIILNENFIRNVMDELAENELRAYLKFCMLAFTKQKKEISEICEVLKINDDELFGIITSLEKKELIKFSSSAITLVCNEGEFARTTRMYTPEEVQSISDTDFSLIRDTAEKAYRKLLSNNDIMKITEIYKWLKLPCAVMCVLIEYCAVNDKKSISYLEKTALDWNKQEIDTPQKAHEYIKELENKRVLYDKIKSLLGIYGRNLTKKEKGFIDKWQEKFSEEEIKQAYEETIDKTGKISFAYTDKILNSEESEPKKPKRTTKFNNFSQKSTDYDDVEKKALERLMNKMNK